MYPITPEEVNSPAKAASEVQVVQQNMPGINQSWPSSHPAYPEATQRARMVSNSMQTNFPSFPLPEEPLAHLSCQQKVIQESQAGSRVCPFNKYKVIQLVGDTATS